MKQFVDNAGRSWAVDINVNTLKRVKSLAGVDLLEVLDGTLVDKFIRDPVLLCDVIYVVCKPEADLRGVNDEEFGRSMAGDAIEHATEALLDDVVNFFPNPRDRAALGQILAATRVAMDKARDLVETRIESGELEKAIDEALATAGNLSTGVPESSDVTHLT